jgi:mono/diheme cytochrome c family protein
MRTIILSISLLVASSGLAFAQDAAPIGDAANGKKLFMADGCYQCHGTEGQGSRGTGPALAALPLPYDAFTQQLRHPADVMPPYTEAVLSDTQAADIFAFVRGLPGPASPSKATILH